MKDLSVLNSLLDTYIDNPENPDINFKLGIYYHSIEQTASAVSFYLRAAERAQDKLMTYECLLRAAMCFHTQGCRNNSVEGMLQHAVALLPKRPEAYFHLARFYEKTEKWFNSYMISCIGLDVAESSPSEKLMTQIDYPGFWAIQFERAVCSWWCGLCEESKKMFLHLIFNEPMDKLHKDSVLANIKKLNFWPDESELNTYFKTKEEEVTNSVYHLDIYLMKNKDNLKFKFEGHESILRNYSETMQDMFVLTMLNGKKNGTYLEIGSGFPIFANNTYLLEQFFGWQGITLDNQKKFIQKHILHRNNIALAYDATKTDYKSLMAKAGYSMNIDYLQIDCGDSEKSFAALKKVVEDGIRFKVLTFSHDHYQDKTKGVKEKSRKYLAKNGYTLFLSNVSHTDENDYEDWYVDSEQISVDIFKEFKDTSAQVKNANKILLR